MTDSLAHSLCSEPIFPYSPRHQVEIFLPRNEAILKRPVGQRIIGYHKGLGNDPIGVLNCCADRDDALVVNHDGADSGLDLDQEDAVVHVGLHGDVELGLDCPAVAVRREEWYIVHLDK